MLIRVVITAIFKEDGTAHQISIKKEIYDLMKIWKISGVSCVPGDVVSHSMFVYIKSACTYVKGYIICIWVLSYDSKVISKQIK